MASAAEWAKRVKAWRASGATAGEFATGKGFADSTLRWWSWQLSKREPPAAVVEPMRLVRLVRHAADAGRASPVVAASPVTIEVGGARVSVVAGFDRQTLREVLDVVRGAAVAEQ